MLEIKNLHAEVGGKQILNGLSLTIGAGEIHAVMGPNGSGKSTLAAVIAGKPGYTVTEGTVQYKNDNLLDMDAEERARAGVFLGFQYPVEIPGVSNSYFLKAAVNAARKARGESEIDAISFLKELKAAVKQMDMADDMLKRGVNEGFSGGEKKRNEILQMLMLKPSLAVLDETDSGLDIDALKVVGAGVNSMRDPDRSLILVTHYQRLLDYITPDQVHVLAGGKIIRSGGPELAKELEERGYEWLTGAAA